MDPTRKANREDNEKTLQYQSRQETQLVEEMNEGKLAQLLAMINQLEQSPAEAAELQRRVKLFGECKRFEGETSGQFYGRLRHWLGRPMLNAKAPLHAPRQTDEQIEPHDS